MDAVLICGPDPMRVAVRHALERRGVAPARIHEESFASPRAAQGSSRPETATILRSGGSRRAFEVKPGQSLLDAALDAGEAIRFSCMSGGCGACRVTVVEGRENVAIGAPSEQSEEERARGVAPACITRLRGPVSFRVGD